MDYRVIFSTDPLFWGDEPRKICEHAAEILYDMLIEKFPEIRPYRFGITDDPRYEVVLPEPLGQRVREFCQKNYKDALYEAGMQLWYKYNPE